MHLHLIFRPELTQPVAAEFLLHLQTQVTDENNKRVSCRDLQPQHYEAATVARVDIEAALKKTFGDDKAVRENVVWVVPANNDGIRADGTKRHAQLADEIDKSCDALFGNPGSVDWYLNENRYEASVRAKPKPVFSGCDAHSLDDLNAWLGKTVTDGTHKHVTWIKADPTFDGLLQTLIEPRDRVRIAPTQPDLKEPYKVISAVTFEPSDVMPTRIEFNSNLVSIVGSRSSGKSALLAYIAHAVDPTYTVEQQQQAQPHLSPGELGPAARIRWDSPEAVPCKVEWSDGESHSGRVIYIPQNSLFALSARPEEITEQIKPAIHRADPDFADKQHEIEAQIRSINVKIREAVDLWFSLQGAVDKAIRDLTDLGDRAAIEKQRDHLAEEIRSLRAASSLTEEETAAYQGVVDSRTKLEIEAHEVATQAAGLTAFLFADEPEDGERSYLPTPAFSVDVRLHPDLTELPPTLQPAVSDLLDEITADASKRILQALTTHQTDIDARAEEISAALGKIKTDNAALIAKNEANVEIEALVARHRTQEETLARITQAVTEGDQIVDQRHGLVATISSLLADRREALARIAQHFTGKARSLEGMTFGLEQGVSKQTQSQLAARFNKAEIGPYVTNREADVDKAAAEPGPFLEALASGTQKVLQTPRRGKRQLRCSLQHPSCAFSLS